MATPPPPVPAIPFSLAATLSKDENHDELGSGASYLDGTDRAYPGQKPSVELMLPDGQGNAPDATYNQSSELSWILSTSNTPPSNSDNGKDTTTFERLSKDAQPYGSPYGRPSAPQLEHGILATQLRSIKVSKGKDMDRVEREPIMRME